MGDNSRITEDLQFPLELTSKKTWGHLWEPAAKIFSLLVFVFGVVLLGTLEVLTLSLLLTGLAACTVKVPLLFLLKRVRWALPFLFFIFVGLIVGRGLDYFYDSLYFASVISLKALTSIIVTVLVLATLPQEELFKGLARLKVPGVIINVLFLSYRYIFLFQQVFIDTKRALAARGFNNAFSWSLLKVYGEIAGALFLKALDRSEIVLKAMEARGFHGSTALLSPGDKKFAARDAMKTILVIMMTGLLLWLDRRALN